MMGGNAGEDIAEDLKARIFYRLEIRFASGSLS